MLRFRNFVFILLALLISGCPQLPDYALPHIGPSDIDSDSLKQGFTYRDLKVGDFRAPSLPEHLAEHAKKFYAYSRIQIRPTADSKYAVTSRFSDYYNKRIWYGNVQSLAFEALMLPDNSWWNSSIPDKKTPYVLQHEQIHFALMEIAARQLTRQAQKNVASFFVIDSSQLGARDQLIHEAETLIKEKNEEVLREHTDFDNQTSLYVDPEKQQWWFDRVNSQLRESTFQKK